MPRMIAPTIPSSPFLRWSLQRLPSAAAQKTLRTTYLTVRARGWDDACGRFRNATAVGSAVSRQLGEGRENQMARDVTDTVRDALGNVVREALKNATEAAPTKSKSSGPFSGAKGVAAGVGLAAAAPLVAKKGVDAVRGNGKLSGGA